MSIESPASVSHPQKPRDRKPEVMDLAALGAGDRRELRRPAPAGLPLGAAHGRFVEVHELGMAFREGASLVRVGECLDLESRQFVLLQVVPMARCMRS